MKGGVLNGKYDFNVCATTLYSTRDVVTDKNISLHSALQLNPNVEDVVLLAVSCNHSGTKKCQTNWCSCFKAKLTWGVTLA